MLTLSAPGTELELIPGQIVRLGRFNTKEWTVRYGWYTYGGNRPVCGWYLTCDADHTTKPLQLTDLDDIYFVS